MKVHTVKEYYDGYYCGSSFTILVNDKQLFYLADYGEPEDKTLCRNFSSIYYIPELMKMAYEAGKKGEELVFTEIKAERSDT